MKKVKFTIVLFLLVTGICGLYAEEEVFTEGDFKYTVEDGKATITDYTGSAENLIIPTTLDGYEVTHIGDAAFFGSYDLILTLTENSYALKYALEKGIAFVLE